MTTSWDPPTAHALVLEVAATDPRAESTPGFGVRLGWTFHVVPFQCSMRVLSNVLSLRRPTAQALVGDVAATPISKLLASGFGLAWTFHAVPFQCSIRVWTELTPVSGSGPLEE